MTFERAPIAAAPAPSPLQPLRVPGWRWGVGLAAGARASMAHPHVYGDFDQVKALIVQHRELGLEGLEAYYGAYGRAESESWLRLCRSHDLVATGGSDFHGEMSPAVTQPGIELPAPVAERLLAWLDPAA